ncbi:MAG: hypothetical protein V4726_11500 [Verrucomicrobiota bacterium]
MSRHRYSDKERKSHVADWERTQPPRVWRMQFRLLIIVLMALVTWISLPATVYFTVMLITNPSPAAKVHVVVSILALVVSYLAGLLVSASSKCSLCHSTPFLQRRHRKHPLANDLPLLTYRASAIVHLLLRGRFRCMYCSTPYRIGFKSRED